MLGRIRADLGLCAHITLLTTLLLRLLGLLGLLAMLNGFNGCATLHSKKKALQSTVTTSSEMLAIAQQFSQTIGKHFDRQSLAQQRSSELSNQPNNQLSNQHNNSPDIDSPATKRQATIQHSRTPQDDVLIALFPTKNNTITDLPLDYLNFALVGELLKRNIRTVRVEDRTKALDELEFQLSGLGEGNLAPGRMKSPNYFIQIVVDENRYLLNSKTRRIERTFNLEVRSVQTQLVILSDTAHQVKDGALLRNTYSF